MFIPKCKKCGGKVISAYTNIEIETNGVLKTVTNTPAKKCSKCGHMSRRKWIKACCNNSKGRSITDIKK